MADTELKDLTSGAPAEATDIIYAVKDPGGTPSDAKLTLAEVKTLVNTPGGSDTQVQFNDGGAFGGDAGLTFNKTSKALTLGGATVTTSAPVVDASQTWNDGGVTFTGLKFNATDTASASGSLLMDLQVDGSSRFYVRKDGAVVTATGGKFVSGLFDAGGGNQLQTSTGLYLSSGSFLRFNNDAFLGRRAAANLRLGAADAAAPVAQTLSVQSVAAGNSNVAGANLTITGSQGTGTGAGGSIIFQVAPAGVTPTAQNALVDALTITSASEVQVADRVRFGGLTWLKTGTNGNLEIGYSTSDISARIGYAGVQLNNSAYIGFQSGLSFTGQPDTTLYRDAANTLALRNGANGQALRVYNTYTSATDFERANIFWDSNVLKIGTEKGSAGGTARALEFQTDGTTRLTIAASSYDVAFAGSGALTWAGRSTIVSPAADKLGLRSAGGGSPTNFILDFGGTTSSFPALKRSSTTLIARLADDSANAALESASLKTDAPTGGTAATWKLGTVASVSPTSPDRTIEVEIGGTTYYISAKTTND